MKTKYLNYKEIRHLVVEILKYQMIKKESGI